MDVRNNFSREVKALWGDGTGPSLGVIATSWGLILGTPIIYPVILPHLRTYYDLSLATVGLLMTVLGLFTSLGQLPGGVLADWFSERKLLAGSTVIAAGAVAVVITADTRLVLFAATAVWRVGQSLYPIARITFLSNIYPDRLGSALGVTMAVGDLGQVVLPAIAGFIAFGVSWQAGLGYTIVPLILAGVVITITVPSQDVTSSSSNNRLRRDILDVMAMMREPAIGFMTVVLFLYIFIWISFTAFYPTYLTTVTGLSSPVASLMFGLFFAVGVVVKPIGGAAYDRVGMRASLTGALLPAFAGFVLLPVLNDTGFLVSVTVLMSVMTASGTITQSYLSESFPEELQGTALGVVRAASATLGASGPVIFGLIADYGYFN
jgi:MFS family permease